MFEVVENVDLAACSLGRNDFMLLRHVSGPVNFSAMVDL